MRYLLVIAIAMVLSAPAFAQARKDRLGVPGGIIGTTSDTTDASGSKSTGSACGINVFTNNSFLTILADIQKCVGKDVGEAATTVLSDWQGALDSATTANDKTAISCLTPAVAIIKAAAGTPGTPGNPNATPPVAATPAVYPGPVTLFQKVREFALAGGIAACKSAINSTNAMLLAP